MSVYRKICEGCYNDFYNNKEEKGCWSFSNAKVVSLTRVGAWQPPPYAWKPEKRMSCYYAQGYSMLPKTDSRIIKKKKDWRKNE